MYVSELSQMPLLHTDTPHGKLAEGFLRKRLSSCLLAWAVETGDGVEAADEEAERRNIITENLAMDRLTLKLVQVIHVSSIYRAKVVVTGGYSE